MAAVVLETVSTDQFRAAESKAGTQARIDVSLIGTDASMVLIVCDNTAKSLMIKSKHLKTSRCITGCHMEVMLS